MRNSKSSSSIVSTEQRNWNTLFHGMVHMIRTQQQQFLKDRKLFEDIIKIQRDGWESDNRLYKDHLSELEGILEFKEKKRFLDGAKAELTLGFKQREASFLNYILGDKDDELADFKALFEILSRESCDGDPRKTNENTDRRKKGTRYSNRKSSKNVTEEEKASNKLKEEELRKYEKSLDLSALLAEKNFVWNQYKIMENEYLSKLSSKQCEVEEANVKIETFVCRMEKLQAANDEKDGTISRLESKLTSMEDDTKRLKEEMSKLSAELEILRKSRKTQETPVLNRCTAGTKNSGLACSNSSRSKSNLKKELSVPIANNTAKETPVLSRCTAETKNSGLACNNSIKSRSNVKKELSVPIVTNTAKDSEKENRRSKRKEGPVILVSETPKLFSSNFKVPKLKDLSSPRVR